MPSPDELSEILDIPREKIADTLRVSGPTSLWMPFCRCEDTVCWTYFVNNDSPNADSLALL